MSNTMAEIESGNENEVVMSIDDSLAELQKLKRQKALNDIIQPLKAFAITIASVVLHNNPPDFAKVSNAADKKDAIAKHTGHISSLQEQQLRQNGNDTLVILQTGKANRLQTTLISEQIAQEKKEIAAVQASPPKKTSDEYPLAILGAGMIGIIACMRSNKRMNKKLSTAQDDVIKSLKENHEVYIYPFDDRKTIQGELEIAANRRKIKAEMKTAGV